MDIKRNGKVIELCMDDKELGELTIALGVSLAINSSSLQSMGGLLKPEQVQFWNGVMGQISKMLDLCQAEYEKGVEEDEC